MASFSDVRRRYLQIDSSNVADVLDDMGLSNQGLHAEFGNVRSTDARLAGWAYTIRGQMVPSSERGDENKMRACGEIGQDEVSVWSGDGSGVCYFGELIALGMHERGAVGALVDGGVRDLQWLRQHELTVFARYRTPIQSIGRWRVTAWREPVYLRGATTAYVIVNPGDFILGDEDGVMVIPKPHVEAVLERAEALTAQEATIRAELATGLTLSQALEKFGHV